MCHFKTAFLNLDVEQFEPILTVVFHGFCPHVLHILFSSPPCPARVICYVKVIFDIYDYAVLHYLKQHYIVYYIV